MTSWLFNNDIEQLMQWFCIRLNTSYAGNAMRYLASVYLLWVHPLFWIWTEPSVPERGEQQLPRCHTPGPLPLEFLDFAQIPHHCRRQLGDSFMSSERRPFGCSGLEGPSWREESVFVSRQLLQRLPAHCCTHCCVSCFGPAVRLCRSLFNMVQGLPEPCREPCQVWVRGCRVLRGEQGWRVLL